MAFGLKNTISKITAEEVEFNRDIRIKSEKFPDILDRNEKRGKHDREDTVVPGQPIIAFDKEKRLYLEARRETGDITKQTKDSKIHFKTRYKEKLGEVLVVPTLHTIQTAGARSHPQLKVGDLVLAKAYYKKMNTDGSQRVKSWNCYAPGIVGKIPPASDLNLPRKYKVLLIAHSKKDIQFKKPLTRSDIEKISATIYRVHDEPEKPPPFKTEEFIADTIYTSSLEETMKKLYYMVLILQKRLLGTKEVIVKREMVDFKPILDLVQELQKPCPDDILEVKEPSVWLGRNVLARWKDDSWFYWSDVVDKWETDRQVEWQVEDISGETQWTTEDDILTDDHLAELQVEDYVIAPHPHFTNSYAPGTVRTVYASGYIQVVLYNDVTAVLTPEQAFKITEDKYDYVKRQIKNLEKTFCEKQVLARDDLTGVYCLGKVISVEDEYMNYKIKWESRIRMDTGIELKSETSEQTVTQLFPYPPNKQPQDSGRWLYVLAPTDDEDYLPGTYSQQGKVLLCDGSRKKIEDPAKSRCFWLTKDYFCNAIQFYYSKNPEKDNVFIDILE